MQKPIFAAATKRVSLAETFRTPVFTPLMQQRVLAAAICGAAMMYLVLSVCGLTVWHCPMREILGVSCPSCGLTRATVLLLHGRLRESLQMHVYAPLLIFGFVLLLGAAALPREYSRRLTALIERFEKRTSLCILLLALLPVYWLIRLALHAAPM